MLPIHTARSFGNPQRYLTTTVAGTQTPSSLVDTDSQLIRDPCAGHDGVIALFQKFPLITARVFTGVEVE